jgi:molybdopterin molybdotransferase
MRSIGEALREIVPHFAPLGPARVPLRQALGSVLFEDVLAGTDLPAFDNSAMDGYAVRHGDLLACTALPVVGESRAGGTPQNPLCPHTAMRIFTGAPLPEGADTVVIQENTTIDEAGATFDPQPEPGANVRLRASDLARGALALPRGQLIGPGEIGLLAAQGQHTVAVYQRPRVAILSTGDELCEVGEHAPFTIVNSNAYALAAQIEETGALPWILPIAKDRLDDIGDKLAQALRADVVLSAGGVSVGDYDLVARALETAGVELKLWKVAIKPGKPLLFGLAGRVPVVGLPGNPISAMVTFEVFVKPGLRRMLGHEAPYPCLVQVELEREHRHGAGRTELARAHLGRAEDGRLIARLHTQQGSGSLPSMCGIDALVVLDSDVEHYASGARVRALVLRGTASQSEPPFA